MNKKSTLTEIRERFDNDVVNKGEMRSFQLSQFIMA